jgi:imidazolonepropionase-like amidohydrolase
MTQIVKALANTAAIGTSNTSVANTRLVRVLNVANTPALLTISNLTANAQVGSYVVGAGAEIVIRKKRDDVLFPNNAATVLGVPIAFSY